MKRSLLLTLVLIFTMLVAGCSKAKAPTTFDATVTPAGNTASITVDVPGWKMGQDYHPHLRLNGGPEVMIYANPYTFKNLKPGKYELLVGIADPEHNPFPNIPDKTLTFEIK